MFLGQMSLSGHKEPLTKGKQKKKVYYINFIGLKQLQSYQQ